VALFLSSFRGIGSKGISLAWRADMISFAEFKKMELRVAEVVSVETHPNADKLYVMKINLGGEERQIVAGLKPYYKPEELQGKKIVVVTNLEPVVLRGEKSEGMLLAAQDGPNVIIVVPERDVHPGSPIL
jgi:methionyl-tRNA synthetase